MNFLSFDSVVRQICRNMDDPTAQNYLKVATTLKTVIDQLNIHVFRNFKTDQLVINDNLTVDLPAGCAVVTKVGTLTSKGTIQVFGYDGGLVKLADTPDCGCSEESATSSSSCPACTFHSCWMGGYYGELYGYRQAQFPNGRWREDYANNRIILGSGYDVEAGGMVLMEYKSSMDNEDAMMQIPSDAYAMLMMRTFQIMTSFSNPGASRAHAQSFKVEYDTYKRASSNVSVKDIISAFRGQHMSAVKG